jgi:hypothetical protein
MQTHFRDIRPSLRNRNQFSQSDPSVVPILSTAWKTTCWVSILAGQRWAALVADDLEGQADQDRREGSEPQPLCYLPDGRGRMPVWDSSGESRLNRQNVLQRLNQQTGIVSDVPVLLNVEEQPRSTRGVDPTRLKRTVRETPLRVRGAA